MNPDRAVYPATWELAYDASRGFASQTVAMLDNELRFRTLDATHEACAAATESFTNAVVSTAILDATP